MYERHWGLKEKPFRNTPDPRFLYFSRAHEEALVRLLYAVTEGKGAMLLTGNYGCGKTLLSRVFLHELNEDRYEAVLLSHPNLSPAELLAEIVLQLQRNPEGCSKTDLNRLLEEALQEHFEARRHTIVLIDEAQLIVDPLTLEEIRLLLNYQRNDQFLLTLILMGQPEVQKHLEGSPQLSTRLSLRYHLGPLSAEDTAKYIAHRLKVAGRDEPAFSDKAIHAVYAASQGIPRAINNIGDLALLIGFGDRKNLVDEAIVKRVVEDLQRQKR